MGAGLQVFTELLLDPSAAGPALVNINSGATVQGNNGISIDMQPGSGNTPITRKVTVINVDGGNVKGLNGAAIAATDGTTDINMTGNSTLTSSNNVLLNTQNGHEKNNGAGAAAL